MSRPLKFNQKLARGAAAPAADGKATKRPLSPPRFHARHNCIGRSYLYRISRRKTAFGKKHVWWVRDRLDVKAMAEAVRLFAVMHDFASFAKMREIDIQ